MNYNQTYIDESGIVILSDADYLLFVNGSLSVFDIYKKVGLVYE